MNPNNATDAKTMGKQAGGNCTAKYSICAAKNCTPAATVTVSAGLGSLYANLLPSSGHSLPKKAAVFSSAPF